MYLKHLCIFTGKEYLINILIIQELLSMGINLTPLSVLRIRNVFDGRLLRMGVASLHVDSDAQ